MAILTEKQNKEMIKRKRERFTLMFRCGQMSAIKDEVREMKKEEEEMKKKTLGDAITSDTSIAFVRDERR